MYCGTLQSWFSCEFLAISYQKMPCILSTISLFSVLPTFPLTPSNYLRRWWLQGKQTMRNLWTWFSRPNSKWRTRDSMTLSRCSCSLQSAVEESWPLEGGHPHVLPSQSPVKTNTRLKYHIVYLLFFDECYQTFCIFNFSHRLILRQYFLPSFLSLNITHKNASLSISCLQSITLRHFQVYGSVWTV